MSTSRSGAMDSELPVGAGSIKIKRILPSLTFSGLTFSDGTEVSLEPDDVVVFVGPNNAGKARHCANLSS